MRYIFTLILIITLCLFTYGQTSPSFDIEVILITDSTQFKSPNDFIKYDSAFYQDDDYYVRSTCSGEWGGSIWFKNKKTGIEYSCSATCPVIINKIGDKYILTNTLAHMCGSSEVVEIEFPDSMDIFKMPPPREKKRKIEYRLVGDNESKSKKATSQLVDTACAMIHISFPYDGQLYHIVSDSKKLYLSQIRDNKLVTIDTVYSGLDNFYKQGDRILYIYSTDGFRTRDNHYIVLYENSGLVGFLDIFENKIKLIRYY
jgi:hypothetical protein